MFLFDFYVPILLDYFVIVQIHTAVILQFHFSYAETSSLVPSVAPHRPSEGPPCLDLWKET